MHTLCAITHHLCPLWNVPNPWQPYHCLDTWKHSTHYINPSKMEQGCLNCRGTENNDMQNFSPEKQVYFLSKRGMQKRNNWKCTRYLEDFFLFSSFFLTEENWCECGSLFRCCWQGLWSFSSTPSSSFLELCSSCNYMHNIIWCWRENRAIFIQTLGMSNSALCIRILYT